MARRKKADVVAEAASAETAPSESTVEVPETQATVTETVAVVAEMRSVVVEEPAEVPPDDDAASAAAVGEEAVRLKKPYVFKRHSHNSMKVFRESPRRWRRRYVEGIFDDDSKPAYEFGKAFAVMLLEPNKREEKILVAQTKKEGDGRTVEGKALALLAEAQKKILITKDEFELMLEMIDAVCACDAASDILNAPDIEREKDVEWTCPTSGLPMKGRLDILSLMLQVIVDVKTTDHALSPDTFGKDAFNFQYDVQTGLYLDAMETITGTKGWRFLHIVVCKNRTFGVEAMVAELDERAVSRGRLLHFNTAEDLKLAQEFDSFSSPYSVGIQPVSLPGWAFSRK